MPELLTAEIANEYRILAENLPEKWKTRYRREKRTAAGTSKEMRTVGTAGNQYFEWFSCQRLHSNKRKGVCRE